MLAARVGFIVAVVILAMSAAAAPNKAPLDNPTPASTSVAGTAFGETFKAGYAYAKRDIAENTVFVFFGNGKTGGCEVTSTNETAFVGMNHPALKGTYTATPAEAYFSTASLEPRAFTSFKINVDDVTDKTVKGAIEMTSPKGKIAGDFNAQICPGSN
ncbi:MAG: hypothetical protein AAB250_09620 [Bdellovibrionota bacterium]